MLALVTVKDRIALLPHFFRYYQALGCSRFICALYNGQENPLYEEVCAWKDKFNVEVRPSICCDPSEWCGKLEAEAVEEIRRTLSDQWHVMADLDEFYWLPDGLKVQDIAQKLETGSYTAATTFMIDRIAADGALAAPGPSLDDTYPLACNITQSVGGCPHKIMLVRSTTPLWSGHHYVGDDSRVLHYGECHHFKWMPGILELLMERYESYVKLELPWAVEGPKTLAKFVNGKLNFADPDIRTWPAPSLHA